jgi:S-adenosylmethionine:tRNA ribosyltransferase-isomerase
MSNLEQFATLGCEKLVAASAAEPRDSARLLVLHRDTGVMEHRVFRDIREYLRKGDCIVINDTKVFPAKLPGKKSTGGKTELLLVHRDGADNRWAALCRDGKSGLKIIFGGDVSATAVEKNAQGEWIFEFSIPSALDLALAQGQVPLPHYIEKARKDAGAPKQTSNDKRRYQTVFARETGSIAAPTAGFHFTDTLVADLKADGIMFAPVTLHVGWGTFRPVLDGDPKKHTMLAEFAQLSPETADKINAARAAGGRIISVGTTSTRTLESFSDEKGLVSPGAKWADIFIYPPYRFKAPDILVTNFHVPSSTPLFMAAAFAGEEKLFAAYTEAVKLKYRFYSYGDSMMII